MIFIMEIMLVIRTATKWIMEFETWLSVKALGTVFVLKWDEIIKNQRKLLRGAS
jgi:hypothetical protein